MTRKLVFNCDKCGVEIHNGKVTLDLTGLPVDELEYQSDTEKRLYDMCRPCWDAVVRLLKPLDHQLGVPRQEGK